MSGDLRQIVEELEALSQDLAEYDLGDRIKERIARLKIQLEAESQAQHPTSETPQTG